MASILFCLKLIHYKNKKYSIVYEKFLPNFVNDNLTPVRFPLYISAFVKARIYIIFIYLLYTHYAFQIRFHQAWKMIFFFGMRQLQLILPEF